MPNEYVNRRKDAKAEPEKYCAYCGAQLHRKRYGKRLEDSAVFARRKYCDMECMRRAFLKIGEHDEQTVVNAHTTARGINALILHKNACEICGSTRNLDIHHIDGNWNNNNPENLQCLCRSCHMKIHRPKPKCVICGAPVKGYGYCDKHYQRYKKYGTPYGYFGKDERTGETIAKIRE